MLSSPSFPRFHSLLDGSPFEGELLNLQTACDEVLTDNKMPFFAAYTDHGMRHITSVLKAAEKLIPGPVWDELLEPADAAVLIGAIYLHDIALHLREPGFQALISGPSEFKPLPWFQEDRPQRPADRPWPELWQEFRKEARQFSRSQLDRLLGPSNPEVPQIAYGDFDTEPSRWNEGDLLLVGEFIRRHHARLAHEIAIHGFPAIADADFPSLGQRLPQLADAIGVTARSHNENLRVMLEYFSYRAAGNPRPDGAVLPYLMGVLRIADYSQLQADRATPLLLHLREPQSPQSIEEWEKHQSISTISWGGDDPLAIYIQASPPGNLRTHLHLTELIEGLQSELDVTTAVLSETYGGSGVDRLRLAHQRVRTNLEEDSLHDQLSFVPRRARLRSAEDLFRLVVSDLYGEVPAVAGRELLQNAIDAVRERHHWEARNGGSSDPAEFRDLPADVLVEVKMLDEESGLLRVVDRGVGMTPSIVIDNFLTAGATFSDLREEDDELDAATAIKWMKAGKFGVGAFAAFLLGSRIQVTTRHISAKRGVSFVADLDSDLVQLDWDDKVPFGTETIVPFSASALPTPRFGGTKSVYERAQLLLRQIEDFYELRNPGVCYRIATEGKSVERDSRGSIPTPSRRLPDDWRAVSSPGFDAILWCNPRRFRNRSFGSGGYHGAIAHNGIVIHPVDDVYTGQGYHWADPIAAAALDRPSIAVFDTRHRLAVSLNRYQLVEPTLPFEAELLDSIGRDMLALALVAGERKYPLGERWGLTPVVSRRKWFPLLPDLVNRYGRGSLCVLWRGAHSRASSSAPFLNGRSLWRQLPLRTALTAQGHRRPSERERDQWGLTVEDVEESASSLAKSLGWEVAAGTIVRRHPSGSKMSVLFDPRHEVFERFDGGLAPPRFSHHPHMDRVGPMPASDLDRLLVTLGGELADERFSCVGLTVLRPNGKGRATVPLSPLSSPWATILGDGLPRAPKARAERRNEITGENRQVRIFANKWERTLERSRRPARARKR